MSLFRLHTLYSELLFDHAMDENSNIWFLEDIDLYEFLCPTKLSDSEEKRSIHSFKRGDYIYFPAEPSNEIFLLHSGRVKIGSYSADGKEVIKAVLGPGELFGELSLSGEGVRADFAQAIDDVEVCSMNLDEIEQLMKGSTSFSLKITKVIGQKLVKTERRLESLVFKDARTRIIEYLCDAANEYGKPVGTETLIDNVLTHREIAHLTGTSRQTVTTILNELREQNHIYFDRKRILIRDRDNLQSMAGREPITNS